jgi:spore germination cell wall hydrolase CwlJ-like protein
MITAKLLLVYLLTSTDVSGLSTIDTSQVDPQEAYCLAENIYYEARSEDIQGQFAVASVTLNRASNPRFPSTVCGVVKQTAKSRITDKLVCAFSWYCDNEKKGREIPVNNSDGSINKGVYDQFQKASIVAITALSGNVKDITKGATHFHNPFTSSPAWKYEMVKTVSVGHHDFYR